MRDRFHSGFGDAQVRTAREIFRLLACGALLTGFAYAQVRQSAPGGPTPMSEKDSVADAMARLKQGDFFPADVNLIANAKGVKAIPELKEQFDQTGDHVLKSSVASALVKLGDKDPAPWDYLVTGATDAIVSDAPSPQRFYSNGKLLSGLSPELVAWAKAHKLTDSELQTKMFELPSNVSSLAESGDRRAIPLLRQALFSTNYMIQATAAQGLAEFQDKTSVPLIIEACQRAPSDVAFLLARFLLDFNDPQAQSAAKEFRPTKNAR